MIDAGNESMAICRVVGIGGATNHRGLQGLRLKLTFAATLTLECTAI